MFKKIIYLFLLVFFVASCGNSFDAVKRGLTGEKQRSTDEFLIQKKDPLILPPDYENLPSPDETTDVSEEESIFEKTLDISSEEDPSTSRSTEESILKKIRKK